MNFSSFEGKHTFSATLATVCLYLILSPVWAPGFVPRSYDDARYFELAILALLLVPFASAPVRNAVTLSWMSIHPVVRTLTAMFLAGGALTVAVSPGAHFGSMEVALQVQLVLLILMVSAAAREQPEQTRELLVISICAGAALCTLKFWVTYVLFAMEGKVFPWVSPFLDFANVRFFSQYQSYTLLLVALPGLLFVTSKWARFFFFVVAANFWALHWMAGTRAMWIGLVVGIATVLVFARQNRVTWLRSQFAVAVAGAAIFLALSHYSAAQPQMVPVPGINSIVDRDHRSINERAELARSAIAFIKDHPLAGVGPGQFGLQSYSMVAAHPHNVVLQLLSEYGIPAGLCGVAVIMVVMGYAVRIARRSSGNPGLVDLGIAGGLATGLTDALFSGNLIMPHSQMLFAVLAGLMLGRMQSPPPVASRDFALTRFAIVSISILAVTVTIILGLEYLPLVRELPPWAARWNPHFWQYGRFDTW